MPSLRDIKKRIQAVKNTGKITKAMKMVAAAKLRKAQDSMMKMRPYADKMRSVLIGLSEGVERETHPLLAVRPRKTVEVIVMTSDKGLCGAFNANILRAAIKVIDRLKSEGLEVNISTIGRKARDYFKRRSIQTARVWTGLSGKIVYSSAQEVASEVIEGYTSETTDEVILIYNEFRSVIAQKVAQVKLLPIEPPEEDEDTKALAAGDYLIEPSEAEILNRLLPKNIEIQIFRALLESQAAEEAARMTAMENATKNTKEMVERLTLQYNKARQAAITAELMDIVGGAEALKQ
ncbi:MAG: ATP synthase F1 subunit gamma [Nitrospirota bacterium]|nr:MAG: ATP synthase F1 subunit gamma [Nitrospirota bacterium]